MEKDARMGDTLYLLFTFLLFCILVDYIQDIKAIILFIVKTETYMYSSICTSDLTGSKRRTQSF